jgi:hypothetical protein
MSSFIEDKRLTLQSLEIQGFKGYSVTEGKAT